MRSSTKITIVATIAFVILLASLLWVIYRDGGESPQDPHKSEVEERDTQTNTAPSLGNMEGGSIEKGTADVSVDAGISEVSEEVSGKAEEEVSAEDAEKFLAVLDGLDKQAEEKAEAERKKREVEEKHIQAVVEARAALENI